MHSERRTKLEHAVTR